MKVQKVLAALALGSSMVLSGVSLADSKEVKPAGAKPEAKPAADAKPAAEAKPVKLVKPWGDLKTLSDEQKAKIDAIHKKALAEINAIEKKEKDDITALLTDANKAEMKDQAEAKKKEATAAKKPAPEKKPDAK
jgi:hypothetical protein